MSRNILALLFTILLYSCGSNNSALNSDNTTEQVPAKLIRFDKELFAIPPDSIPSQIKPIVQRYGTFFELYCTGIIGIASPSDSIFTEQLQSFTTNKVVKEAQEKTAAEFTNVSDINKGLKEGFERYAQIFENKPIDRKSTRLNSSH